MAELPRNWFDIGYDRLIEDTSTVTSLSIEDVKEVYGYLQSIGLIDYDVEKEIIFDTYFSDCDEDGEEY